MASTVGVHDAIGETILTMLVAQPASIVWRRLFYTKSISPISALWYCRMKVQVTCAVSSIG